STVITVNRNTYKTTSHHTPTTHTYPFLSMPRPPPTSTLFPYTTLFRSAFHVRHRNPAMVLGFHHLVSEPQLPQQFHAPHFEPDEDRKSTRLNSSHDQISYAVFCLKKKKNIKYNFNKKIVKHECKSAIIY